MNSTKTMMDGLKSPFRQNNLLPQPAQPHVPAPPHVPAQPSPLAAALPGFLNPTHANGNTPS